MPKPTKHASRKAIAIELPASAGMNVITNPVAAPVAPEATTTASAGAQGGPAAPARAKSPRKATATKGAARGRKTAAKPSTSRVAKAATKTTTKPARSTKKALILAMLARPTGASVAEIMAKARWLRHTCRAWLSVAGRKPGVHIGSTKDATGERRYRITK